MFDSSLMVWHRRFILLQHSGQRYRPNLAYRRPRAHHILRERSSHASYMGREPKCRSRGITFFSWTHHQPCRRCERPLQRLLPISRRGRPHHPPNPVPHDAECRAQLKKGGNRLQKGIAQNSVWDSGRNRIWRRFSVFCLLSVKVCSWYKPHSNT